MFTNFVRSARLTTLRNIENTALKREVKMAEEDPWWITSLLVKVNLRIRFCQLLLQRIPSKINQNT